MLENASVAAGVSKKVVGLAGLEPTTFRPPDGRATRLRYSPNAASYIAQISGGKQESTAHPVIIPESARPCARATRSAPEPKKKDRILPAL